MGSPDGVAVNCQDRPAPVLKVNEVMEAVRARLLDARGAGLDVQCVDVRVPLAADLELHLEIRRNAGGPSYEERVAAATPRYYFL